MLFRSAANPEGEQLPMLTATEYFVMLAVANWNGVVETVRRQNIQTVQAKYEAAPEAVRVDAVKVLEGKAVIAVDPKVTGEIENP